ncbi:MAG TPA: helix-turn-helix domain-containing protein [Gelria sp.]|jgi:DNA-binding response OmpR family regulator|nr:helix-turn-helix domain-containing protein [Gelria sp.]
MNRMKWNIEKEIMVDMERGDIWVKSGEKLTGAELRILILLRRREGKPVTADMLADQVDPLDFSCSNPRFHIFNLRRKLGHCQERQVIETLKGIGYCLVPGSLQFTDTRAKHKDSSG